MTNKLMYKLIFILIGIGLLVGGFLFLNMNDRNKKYYVRTQATIVDIVEETYVDVYDDGVESETKYIVYVDYVANDTLYQYVPLNEYNFTMKIGDKINVTYDSRNPSVLVSRNGFIIASICCFAGGGAFLIVPLIVGLFKKDKQAEKR